MKIWNLPRKKMAPPFDGDAIEPRFIRPYCKGGVEVVVPVPLAGGTVVFDGALVGTVPVVEGDVVMVPFEVVPGDMVPLLLGVVVMVPVEFVVLVGGVVVVVPFGTVVVVGDVVVVSGVVVVVPGVVVVVVPEVPMVLLLVVPVTPLF